MPTNDLERFVRNALEVLGATIELGGFGVTHVLTPEALAEELGLSVLTTLVFDSETYQETPEATLISYGHPLVDALIARTLGRQRGFRAYASLERTDLELQPERVMAIVEGGPALRKCRKPRLQQMTPALAYDFEFGFVMTFQSSSRIEETTSNLADGRGNTLQSAQSAYARHFWQARPNPAVTTLPMVSSLPLEAVYRRSLARAQASAEVRAQALFMADRRHYQAEYDQVDAYYQETLRELTTKLKNSPADRQTAMAGRVDAAMADRQRRLADLALAYQVDQRVDLDHVRLYAVPRLRIQLAVQHKAEEHPLVMTVNLLTRTLDPVACPRCWNAVTALNWDNGWTGDCCLGAP